MRARSGYIDALSKDVKKLDMLRKFLACDLIVLEGREKMETSSLHYSNEPKSQDKEKVIAGTVYYAPGVLDISS